MALLTKFWGLDLLAVSFVLILVFYLYMTRNFNYWTKRGVKQIPPVPFFGCFKEIILQQKVPGHFFRDWYEKYRPLPYVGFYVLDKPFLLIRDPELVKSVLVKDANYFQDKHLTANPNDTLSAANVFLIKNPAWKYLRSKLTSVYTAGRLKKMFDLMLDVCKDFDTFLESQNLDGPGGVLEMKDVSAKFTTDLIATTAYGIKANSLNNPDAEFRKHGKRIFEFTTYRGYEFLAMFFAPQFVKPLNIQFFQKESTKFLREALWGTLQERQKSGIKRPDLIDLLIELRKNQPEEEKKIFEFDGDNLVAQAAVFFTGGFETSSTVISFCLYELATHPEVQDKVREEIQTALQENNGKITYDMVVSGLPYMDAVISEVLRFYPPLPYLDREASYDYKIPGSDVILKKGTPVLIPMLGFHFDEDYFPDPFRFNPDNFSEENKKARKPGVYMPFGDGPHTCIGLRLGLIQAKLGIITMLSKYEISPCKETLIPMRLNPKAVIVTPDGGVHLTVRKLVK
ncbi:cytochrome P450 6k1 [Fopius arisanus]|uniref:Cytochrome P450 6k1 n=1 Tax=Fopius arisanus TaxID=64838 RepID=A0A9R1T3U9_9HYME|nr:PREDICTED: cytochrome P450 6k1-like [Fopius arisanus]